MRFLQHFFYCVSKQRTSATIYRRAAKVLFNGSLYHLLRLIFQGPNTTKREERKTEFALNCYDNSVADNGVQSVCVVMLSSIRIEQVFAFAESIPN